MRRGILIMGKARDDDEQDGDQEGDDAKDGNGNASRYNTPVSDTFYILTVFSHSGQSYILQIHLNVCARHCHQAHGFLNTIPEPFWNAS